MEATNENEVFEDASVVETDDSLNDSFLESFGEMRKSVMEIATKLDKLEEVTPRDETERRAVCRSCSRFTSLRFAARLPAIDQAEAAIIQEQLLVRGWTDGDAENERAGRAAQIGQHVLRDADVQVARAREGKRLQQTQEHQQRVRREDREIEQVRERGPLDVESESVRQGAAEQQLDVLQTAEELEIRPCAEHHTEAEQAE